MPPRKRARASTASTPLRETQPKTPVDHADDEKDEVMEDAIDPTSDPWTDEQETQLLRGLMRWKPTGIHKHFHMTRLAPSIHHDSTYPTIRHALAAAPHTRIPGIWEKLGQLYNLEGLDEREDARMIPHFDPQVWEDDVDVPEAEVAEGEDDDPLPSGRSWNEVREFNLDEDGFGEMMWAKRFAGSLDAPRSKRGTRGTASVAGSESPPFFGWDNQRTMPSHLDAEPPELADDDDTPKKSSTRSKSATAARSRRGTRGAKAQSEETGEDEEEGEREAEDEEEDDNEDEEPPESSPEKMPAKRIRSRPSLSARRSTRHR